MVVLVKGLRFERDEAYRFAATPLHSSPPSVAQLAIVAVEEACLGEEEEDHSEDHDAGSYRLEGMGDASSWLSPRLGCELCLAL